MNTDTPPSPVPVGRKRRCLRTLDAATCWDRLQSATVGRVVHVVDGVPAIALVNIGVDGGEIVFRSDRGGCLVETLARPGVPATIEVDGLSTSTRTGWSVVTHGRLIPVLDTVEAAGFDRCQPASWLLGDHDGVWIRFRVDEITGREVEEVPSRG